MKLSFVRSLLILIAAASLSVASFAESIRITFHEPATLKIGAHRFDLLSSNGLTRFAAFANRTADSSSQLSAKDRRGISTMLRLLKDSPFPENPILQSQLLELAAAIANNHRPPIPPYVGLPDLPFRFIDSLSNPVGQGRTAANNLDRTSTNSDLSTFDPKPSIFWQKPMPIASQDLYSGFSRERLPELETTVWNYHAPKNTGGNPGCELASGSRRIKVKFAETHAEPFSARVFHALGYHVEPTDFTPSLKIRYDRAFFLKFNSQPAITMKIGLFFVPIHTFHFEDSYDPFDFITRAVFKDGTIHDRRVFKKLLLRNSARRDAAFNPKNFRPEIESQIDHLITVPANVQPKDPRLKSIGPWDFRGLDHENLRELRGAGVLAAWLGWWDSRFENTRLRIVETPSGPELRHYFSDLGATLGRSDGTYRHSYEDPRNFAARFTRSRTSRNGKRRLEFLHFEPIEDTLAFERITFDDARWMARLIGQLTATQITDALTASGFAPDEVQLYAMKLISRRNQLIRDTNLENEFPPLNLPAPDGSTSSERLTARE